MRGGYEGQPLKREIRDAATARSFHFQGLPPPFSLA